LSSSICHIRGIQNTDERHDYVLNLFDKLDDAELDPEDLHDKFADAGDHAVSLNISLEPQTFFPHADVVESITLSHEIVEPKIYALAVQPTHEFHKEWNATTTNREVKSLTDNNPWPLVPTTLNKRII